MSTQISDPIQVGGMTLNNRLIVAATFSNLAQETDFVGARLLDSYQPEGAGGAALVIAQASYVHRQGRGNFPRRLGIAEDRAIPGMEELSSVIRRGGAKAALQLQHARFHSKGDETPGGRIESFSSVDPEMIETAINAFAQAAVRARKAGFDAVEIHACHGSMIPQFFSPLINQRSDQWGQDRDLMGVRVVEAVRAAVGPDFPVIVRVSGEEGVPGGFTIEDTVRRARRLEAAGADAIHVSSGSRSSLAARAEEVGPLYFPMGHLLKHARKVKAAVNLPVIGVGKIMVPRLAREALEHGWADIVALSRPIIADPDYPRKALAGQDDAIRPCIGCNYCYHRVAFRQLSIRCAVNPGRGRESRRIALPAGTPKRVLVAGGGPAGMEAALTAANRGHRVTLCEKTDRLGGQVRLAAAVPGLNTGRLRAIIEFQARELDRLGVTVHLDREVDAPLLAEEKPDVVVVASGACFHRPDLPGRTEADLMGLDEYLENPRAGERVVVVGGRDGAEAAAGLAKKGHQVTLVHPGPEDEIGHPEYIHDAKRIYFLRRFLEESGVDVKVDTTPAAFIEEGLNLSDAAGRIYPISADTIVWATGRKAENRLAENLSAAATGLVYTVGDCRIPQSIVEAIDDGAYTGSII